MPRDVAEAWPPFLLQVWLPVWEQGGFPDAASGVPQAELEELACFPALPRVVPQVVLRVWSAVWLPAALPELAAQPRAALPVLPPGELLAVLQAVLPDEVLPPRGP